MAHKTDLQWKVEFAKEFGETFDVVEHGWVTAYIEQTALLNKEVITYFFFTDSGNKLPKQQVWRKQYKDSKGTYINWHGSKIYFKF